MSDMSDITISKTSLVVFIITVFTVSIYFLPTAAAACELTRELTIVSDTSNTVIETGSNAVATWNSNPNWTAVIPGATWIWKSFYVENPTQDETYTFRKTFDWQGSVTNARLDIAADNSYKVWLNNNLVGRDDTEYNYFSSGQDNYSVTSSIQGGENEIKMEVKNWQQPNCGTAESNPAGALYKLTITGICNENTPPVITLIGNATTTIAVGTVFTDPGATAQDAEDGNITNRIVIGGSVNTAVPGTYIVTYNVTDSGGLAAQEVKRTVIVQVITPSSMYLPSMPACNGNFGTITGISNPSSFSGGFNYDEIPEHYIVLQNATSTYGNNLDWYWVQIWSPDYIEWDLNQLTDRLRIYPSQDHGPYPAELNEYNVQASADRNNWFVLASSTTYIGDINNIKTHDGVKDYSATTTFRYLRIYPNEIGGDDYEIDAVRACGLLPNTPPVITLIGNATTTITVGTVFVDPGATALDTEDGDITSQIVIGGDTVSTSTPGTYVITYNVTDSKGLAAQEVKRTVVVEALPPSNNGGGGGGGGGGGSAPPSNGPPWAIPFPKPSAITTPKPTPQCNYLLEYLRIGQNNNPVEVRKLQTFLRDYEGFINLQVTDFFDQATLDAVSSFQRKYRNDVLEPWGLEDSTGYVYITTKKKVNEIYCQREFSLTAEQQTEITRYRNQMETLRQQGITPLPEIREEVGKITSTTSPLAVEEKIVPETISTSTATAFSGIDVASLVINPTQETEETKSLASAFVCNLASNNSLWNILGIILVALFVFFLYKWQRKRTEPEKVESPPLFFNEYNEYKNSEPF